MLHTKHSVGITKSLDEETFHPYNHQKQTSLKPQLISSKSLGVLGSVQQTLGAKYANKGKVGESLKVKRINTWGLLALVEVY